MEQFTTVEGDALGMIRIEEGHLLCVSVYLYNPPNHPHFTDEQNS